MSLPSSWMRPGLRRDQADDHVERRGLAGAVRAEQADDFPLGTRSATSFTTRRPRYTLTSPSADSTDGFSGSADSASGVALLGGADARRSPAGVARLRPDPAGCPSRAPAPPSGCPRDRRALPVAGITAPSSASRGNTAPMRWLRTTSSERRRASCSRPAPRVRGRSAMPRGSATSPRAAAPPLLVGHLDERTERERRIPDRPTTAAQRGRSWDRRAANRESADRSLTAARIGSECGVMPHFGRVRAFGSGRHLAA